MVGGELGMYVAVWVVVVFVFFKDTASTEIYTYCHTLSLHDALPIWWVTKMIEQPKSSCSRSRRPTICTSSVASSAVVGRSEEHTSELQSLMRNSYAVFCLKQTHPQSIDNTAALSVRPIVTHKMTRGLLSSHGYSTYRRHESSE